ncbi:MAG: response regulator [Planctomycetota bacterium]
MTAGPSSPAADAPDAPVSGPLSIVCVDDDPDFREYMHSLLDAEGHEARVVDTPAAFFDACDRRLPDLVMLDMKMGEHSGADVLAEIRERWPKLCVIIVTGYPTLDSMRDTFKRDVFDYIAKPFAIDDLRRVLNEASVAFALGQRPQDRLRVELGRQLRLARTSRGWTLKELSEASGFSVSQLSSIERGAHLPSLDSLLAIGSALDQQPSAFLSAAGF